MTPEDFVKQYPELEGTIHDTLQISSKHVLDFIEWCYTFKVHYVDEIKFLKPGSQFEPVQVFIPTVELHEQLLILWDGNLEPNLDFVRTPRPDPAHFSVNVKDLTEDAVFDMIEWVDYTSRSADFQVNTSDEDGNVIWNIRVDDPKEAVYFKLNWGGDV